MVLHEEHKLTLVVGTRRSAWPRTHLYISAKSEHASPDLGSGSNLGSMMVELKESEGGSWNCKIY
jgi:hypothetical protein